MPDYASLFSTFGPLVVLVGTFFEGETVVVVAGFAAHQGLGNAYWVAAAAFLGSFLGDQFWFFLGRRYREHRFVRDMVAQRTFSRALGLVERHPILFILSFRFFYGLRTVSPVAIAFTGVSARKFLVLNGIAAAIWATTFTAAGYIFGKSLELLLGKMSAIEHKVLAGLVFGGVVFAAYWAIRKLLRRQDHSGPD